MIFVDAAGMLAEPMKLVCAFCDHMNKNILDVLQLYLVRKLQWRSIHSHCQRFWQELQMQWVIKD